MVLYNNQVLEKGALLMANNELEETATAHVSEDSCGARWQIEGLRQRLEQLIRSEEPRSKLRGIGSEERLNRLERSKLRGMYP